LRQDKKIFLLGLVKTTEFTDLCSSPLFCTMHYPKLFCYFSLPFFLVKKGSKKDKAAPTVTALCQIFVKSNQNVSKASD
jgi:hypothetical protein